MEFCSTNIKYFIRYSLWRVWFGHLSPSLLRIISIKVFFFTVYEFWVIISVRTLNDFNVAAMIMEHREFIHHTILQHLTYALVTISPHIKLFYIPEPLRLRYYSCLLNWFRCERISHLSTKLSILRLASERKKSRTRFACFFFSLVWLMIIFLNLFHLRPFRNV